MIDCFTNVCGSHGNNDLLFAINKKKTLLHSLEIYKVFNVK